MRNKDAEMVKGLTLANEFLKVIRDFKLEETRVDPFPHEVGEVLGKLINWLGRLLIVKVLKDL
jgi:hypothetical protein